MIIIFQPTSFAKKKSSVAIVNTKLPVISKELLDLETLNDKLVECENKNATIIDLRDQLEELQVKIKALEGDKTQLILCKSKYEQAISLQKQEHSKHFQRLMEKFEETLVIVKAKEDKMISDINLLKDKIENLKQEQRKNILNQKTNCDKLKELIEQQNIVLKDKSAELAMKECELKILEKECIDMQSEHAVEIDKMRKAHLLEIQDIEFEFLKTMTELQNEKDLLLHKSHEIEKKARIEIKQMRQTFLDEKQMIIDDFDKQITKVSLLMSGNCKHT